jgi:2-polyprenyl-3-methyl-5-hydroxy-6-metoxy-1,4-benzoquinol methylase
VNQEGKPASKAHLSPYDANYGNFQTELYEEIRREAFGEDIGQNSWLTASELDQFQEWLRLGPDKRLLDVACGAGGPALRMAKRTGCSVTGVDVHEQAISAANALSAANGLANRTQFHVLSAEQKLPFADNSFDAITCIDAINHFRDRKRVVTEWQRLLKPGGRLLFTDPIIVSGPVNNAEVAVRSSAGFYLLVPRGYDEEVLAQCGLRVLAAEDRTRNMAEVAARRWAAREKRGPALREIEGEQGYETQQEFLRVASVLAAEGRLSRFMFVAEKG